jgi:hypothetical protein
VYPANTSPSNQTASNTHPSTNLVPATLRCPCLCCRCSFTANIATCNKRLALIAAVLRLQLDPLGEVFDVEGIQLFSGHRNERKTLGARSCSKRYSGVPVGVRGEFTGSGQAEFVSVCTYVKVDLSSLTPGDVGNCICLTCPV